MNAIWPIAVLLHSIEARGQHPAVITFDDEQRRVLDSVQLARAVRDYCALLHQRGLQPGMRVLLWAPNSPQWIIAALSVLAAGGVLVPIDELETWQHARANLSRIGAGLVITTSARAKLIAAEPGLDILLLDQPMPVTNADTPTRIVPTPDDPTPEDPMLLLATSGTTGTPKLFLLNSKSVGANVMALAGIGVLGPGDRVLLPLPLHHAYPLIVGMLAVLAIGATIVLPAGSTGPQLTQALQGGGVTTIVGVPRLYEAMVAAIDTRIAARGRLARAAWTLLTRACEAVHAATALCPGRLLFAPLRRRVAPRLQYLISGGARLQPETEARLTAMGWTVLVGYGLAETSALFTGSQLGAQRKGSVGKPLAAGHIRIADADSTGTGEIQLRGDAITAGYIDNPDANRTSFTADGWFRTGDLGHIDGDGFLFVTGRIREVLVLGGGKKISPEDLERVYAGVPQIQEIALLEQNGALVALVRPDLAAVHRMGTINLRDAIRVVLTQRGRDLPPYQRLAGFALTDKALPRTRLGKYRRFLLPDLYAEALAGGPLRQARALDAAELTLLDNPTARQVWDVLRQRHPGKAEDLDANLALDLHLDSFGWLELGLVLQDRCQLTLTEADIAACDTVRELLRLSVVRAGDRLAAPNPATAEIEHWLAPPGWVLRALGIVLYGVNWLVMRLIFRLRVKGTENLPASGAFLLTPNHASFLDPMAIAASLPLARLRHAYWAGAAKLLFTTWPRRFFCRVAHVFPVDDHQPGAAIAAATRVLGAGYMQIWFPEGWRSPDGQIQRFLPGIAQVLRNTDVPAVPTRIAGSFDAWPRGRRWPRAHRITVAFGASVNATTLRAESGMSGEDRMASEDRIAAALRRHVVTLNNGAVEP